MKELSQPALVIEAAADRKTLASRMHASHAACETALRASVSHALEAGRMLLKAKERCGHGQWLPWLTANIAVSERTAQSYMKVAKNWSTVEAKAQHVADLTFCEALDLL